MNFSKKLNELIEKMDCNSQELAKASELSSTVISRYRNGERTPSVNGTQLTKLANGLYQICKSKKINLSYEQIYSELTNTINGIPIDSTNLSKNFNDIVNTLNINIADLSRFISYDASFISKIRTGNRAPSKPQEFIDAVCNYVATKYKSEENKKLMAILLNTELANIKTDSSYLSSLKEWFSTNSVKTKNYINDFLNNLDNFDLNEYIKAIHFDEMKVPFVPFYKISSKNYYGIEEMKKGELDFFKATVLSKSKEPIFMCSDMPMEDMAKDIEFGKKWMFGIALSLKKGLHLNIIHNLDRPFNEMMLGLESWIPIYMTGQVSPYYLKGLNNNIYCHLNYTSGAAALCGECINGYHNDGKYFLTTNKNELNFYKKKTNDLLSKANSLMDIYTTENQNAFNVFLSTSSKITGNRKRILSSLPIHTISDNLLIKILKRNNISQSDIQKIKESVNEKRKIMKEILKTNKFEEDFTIFTKESFENAKPTLSLSDCFYEKQIEYTYKEYAEHVKLTLDYQSKNQNYIIKENNKRTFKNIQVLICEGNFVMISKDISPSIHFIIRHPALRNAIENFTPLVVED